MQIEEVVVELGNALRSIASIRTYDKRTEIVGIPEPSSKKIAEEALERTNFKAKYTS